MAAPAATAPVTEIGTTNPLNFPLGLPSVFGQQWATLLDDQEYVPDLKWPNSRRVYDKMRSDPQVHGLWTGMTLPIRRYKWMIDPNGARPEVVQGVSEDLGLPIKGEAPKPRGRTKNRFSHDSHLYHALLALAYGFYFAEQVGMIVNDMFRLRKLAPRLPHTIQEVRIAKDGGLVGITQLGNTQLIPVERLVAYVWEKEGSNFFGRSMFRPLYKPWFIKDKLIRIDLVKHERNGMGVPTAKATSPDVTPSQMQEAQKIVAAWRAGQGASATMPYGTDVELKGVTGNLPDTLASIRYCDEAMARAMLMMFMQLGQTETGSRALGESFLDFFSLAQETVALWYCDTTNEHVIEDWVDWNYGEDEQAPLICYEARPPEYALSDVIALIDAGAIVVDNELEDALRDQAGLPPRDPNSARPPAPAPAPAAPPGTPAQARRGRRTVARTVAAEADNPLPDRVLRRELYEQEVASKADFKAIDQQWQSALDSLLAKWGGIKSKQIDQLYAQIVEADHDLEKLAVLQADPIGAETIAAEMHTLAKEGAALAATEAKQQGVTIEIPDLTDVEAALTSRANAADALLARSISEAASRKAVAVSGGASLSAEDIANTVRDHLAGLSGNYLKDQFSGLITAAQNAGRKAVMGAGPASEIYSSELLDESTCSPCTAVDGTQYTSLDEADFDYPTGGYMDCEGGPRCRGTLVAVYGETEATIE